MAVDTLATGKGRIHDRLVDAYLSQAMHADPIDAGAFDPELEVTMRAFHERMTRVTDGPAHLGSIHNTVMAMSEDDASQLAQVMTELRHQVESFIEHTEGR